MPLSVPIALLIFSVFAFFLSISKAYRVVESDISLLRSRPVYHGVDVALSVFLPGLVLWLIWNYFSRRWLNGVIASEFSSELSSLSLAKQESFIRDAWTLASGGIVAFSNESKIRAGQFATTFQSRSNWIGISFLIILTISIFLWTFQGITPQKCARKKVERLILYILLACSGVAILTTLGIVFSLIFESLQFFERVSILDFLFGIHWSPQSAFEGAGAESLDDNNSNVFGAIPLFAGTLLITFIAMCVAAPIGLMSAIYLSDYASLRFRQVAKPVLEILAGIPTVVYGFFAALTIAPSIRGWGNSLGLDVSYESALAAGLVMGIMIIPFVSSLSDDVINAVPQSLRDGSAGLGATKSETIIRVVWPAALPGIVSAILLAISRAVGETMIVVMAAGLAANLTINPLEAVTTVTVQIVILLVGDQEFDSAKTLAAFALGLILFFITLVLNVVALRVVQKYREQYD
ncbi:phosphate ABC transporter permease subunit PstC [Candidatus Endowatersipora endosymbiont of Watersipora subatra]|uniref:phosphate ABC transporter permease subunit PstC n=1 Tax=Candidatus Endowatersipora endosymbiont of Watersipora subatra TaxID=3077946 RepID=UPI00312C98F8